MEKAKCLITDSSGIAIEFVLLFKRPTLYFEDIDKIHNTEFDNFKDLITIEKNVKNTFGYTFKPENIKDLNTLISKSLVEFTNKDIEIKNFIEKNFYNYGATVKNFNDLISRSI